MPTIRKMPPLLTALEVARTLKVEPSTVYRWCREGTLSSVRIGGIVRIRATALEALTEPTTEETS